MLIYIYCHTITCFSDQNYRENNAKRQAKWKSKNLEKCQQSDCVKSKSYRERVNLSLREEEIKKKRAVASAKRQIQRLKKKQQLLEAQQNENSRSESLFASRQVQGKLLKRTKHTLKGSPAQNSFVLRSLLKENEHENEQETEPFSHGHSLSGETVEKVVNFFFSDDISRPSPNSKDFVSILEGSQRKKISIRHLMFSVKEVHGMFTSKILRVLSACQSSTN